ncbi:MAG: nicotinamide mononucleotide transporter [Clostridia bacterium]|nr:nicotinamide mononucleotide transporter [Clostridia bacterium]
MNGYFSKSEWALWGGSVGAVLLAFFAFDGAEYLTLVASLIGVTSLIFNAKGNPIGQLLMVVFSLLYGFISYSFSYYGEMVTYLGMTGPMALFALIAWLRHPYKGRRAQVAVNRLTAGEWVFALLLTGVVTAAFYFILAAFHTAYLPLSTLSVTTSFLAVYLTFRRSPWFALVYAGNDVVLILLWVLATAQNPAYLSVVVCFAVFLVNDVYGFVNWRRMCRRQAENSPRGIA